MLLWAFQSAFLAGWRRGNLHHSPIPISSDGKWKSGHSLVAAPADQHPGADKSVESDGSYTGYKVPGPPPPWPDTQDIPGFNFAFHVSWFMHVMLSWRWQLSSH